MSHPLRGFVLRDIPATRRLFCWACACYSCWPFRAASRRFPQLRIGSFCRDLSREIVLMGSIRRVFLATAAARQSQAAPIESVSIPSPRRKSPFLRGGCNENRCCESWLIGNEVSLSDP